MSTNTCLRSATGQMAVDESEGESSTTGQVRKRPLSGESTASSVRRERGYSMSSRWPSLSFFVRR
jgi:hypothetical protein